MNQQTNPPLELWGGVECTFNRVGDRYFDQIEWSGHADRADDLDLFAELGFRALRYPVIWEALAPHRLDEIDWTLPDERLNRLRELGIQPIVGLVHHGSGPRYASIESPDFAPGLADFARRVAQRYPWLDAYTPVNEPLTTARFCGLYGHWYPHGRSNHTFVRVLLNECRAINMAMLAVREINPSAQLVQTDDLGRIYSTPNLAHQAHFENERRWLGFDLVCGRVDRSHIMWQFLMESGATPAELDWLCENPCAPDVIGINHYPTSDRFLDDDIDRYPGYDHAGNGRERYVDIEAIRVLEKPPVIFKERLGEAWERYRLPLAITEAHLGCSREEQMRWLSDAWRAAQELREEGLPIRAVTAWSLLGSWNWNSLVTRDDDYYEPGVFDIRGHSLRPTAMAYLLRDIGSAQRHDHPILEQPGWWRRPHRILGSAVDSQRLHPPSPIDCGLNTRDKSSIALLIVWMDKSFAQELARICDERGLPYYLLSSQEMDADDDPLAVEIAIDATNPWAIVTDIEDAAHLSEVCKRRGIGFAHITDESGIGQDSTNKTLDELIDEVKNPLLLVA